MSKGNGKVELTVLDFMEREQSEYGGFPLGQSWVVRKLKSFYSEPSIRRAIIRLADKGQLYKFADRQGVLISLRPITEKKTISPFGLKETTAPVEPYKPCPVADFEPLVFAKLREYGGHCCRSILIKEILCNTDGCWEVAVDRKYGRKYRRPDYSSEVKLQRTVARMIKQGTLRFWYDKASWHKRGIGTLSFPSHEYWQNGKPFYPG